MRMVNCRHWDDSLIVLDDTALPAPAPVLQAANTSAIDTTTLLGIDVSQYQGTIDFSQVKAAGASFVFIKATEAFEREITLPFKGCKIYEFDGGGYICSRFEFTDGGVLVEFSQARSACGGDYFPVYLALQDGSGRTIEESLWTDEEMEVSEGDLALIP